MNMPSLSEILKSKISKLTVSKAYVASILKVSEKTVENYMNGKRAPKPDALIKLSQILGFSLSELSNEQNVPREKANSIPLEPGPGASFGELLLRRKELESAVEKIDRRIDDLLSEEMDNESVGKPVVFSGKGNRSKKRKTDKG